MDIDSGELFVCIKYRGHIAAAARGGLPPPHPSPASCLLYCVFIHEIHLRIWSPSANWHVHFLTDFRLVGFEVGDGDGLDLDEATRVEGFDLEDFALGDELAGFSVGSAANSGSCTEESLEDEHGVSLSELVSAVKISAICGAMLVIIPSMALVVALAEACAFATYWPMAIDATVAGETPSPSATA